MRKYVLALLLAVAALAQYDPTVDDFYYYEANYSFSLSGAAAAFTLKLPAGSVRSTVPQVAVICSTVDAVITQELGGTATGGTAVTPTALNNIQASITSVLRGATLSGGTAIGTAISIAADDCSPPIDLTKIKLRKGASSDQVYNIRSSTETGTITVGINYAETRK
jgi:hypothetical protein